MNVILGILDSIDPRGAGGRRNFNASGLCGVEVAASAVSGHSSRRNSEELFRVFVQDLAFGGFVGRQLANSGDGL